MMLRHINFGLKDGFVYVGIYGVWAQSNIVHLFWRQVLVEKLDAFVQSSDTTERLVFCAHCREL